MTTDRSNASTASSRRRGVRFGTKTLLLATALVALGCYWGEQDAAPRAAIRHQELSYARWVADRITFTELLDAIDARYRAAERVPFVSHRAVRSHELRTLEELRSQADTHLQMAMWGPDGPPDWLALIDERIGHVRDGLAE